MLSMQVRLLWAVLLTVILNVQSQTDYSYALFHMSVCTPLHVWDSCGLEAQDHYIHCQCDHCITEEMHLHYKETTNLYLERAKAESFSELPNQAAFVTETTDAVAACLCSHCKDAVYQWTTVADSCNAKLDTSSMEAAALERIASVVQDAHSAKSAVHSCTGRLIGKIVSIAVVWHCILMLLGRFFCNLYIMSCRIATMQNESGIATPAMLPPLDNKLMVVENLLTGISIFSVLDYLSFAAVSSYLSGSYGSGILRGMGGALHWILIRKSPDSAIMTNPRYVFLMGFAVLVVTAVVQIVVCIQHTTNTTKLYLSSESATQRLIQSYLSLLSSKQARGWPPQWNLYVLILWLPALCLAIGESSVRNGQVLTAHWLWLILPFLVPILLVIQLATTLRRAPPLPAVNPAPPDEYLRFSGTSGFGGRIPFGRPCAYEGERDWVNLNCKYVESWGVLFQPFKFSGRYFITMHFTLNMMIYFGIGVCLSADKFVINADSGHQMLAIVSVLFYVLIFLCLLIYTCILGTYMKKYVQFLQVMLFVKIGVLVVSLLPAFSGFSVSSSHTAGALIVTIHVMVVVFVFIKDWMFLIMAIAKTKRWHHDPIRDGHILVVDSNPVSVPGILRAPSLASLGTSMHLSPPTSSYSYSDLTVMSEYSYNGSDDEWDGDGGWDDTTSTRRVSFGTSTTLVLRLQDTPPVFANPAIIDKKNETTNTNTELNAIVMEFTEDIPGTDELQQ